VNFEVQAPLGVGLVSAAPERLLAFYGDCLGFEALRPIIFPGTGTVHRFRAAGSILRIYEPEGSSPAPGPTERFDAAAGVRYFTLVVDDVQAVLDACRAFGVVAPGAPTQTAPDTFLAMIQDPDGNWIEVQSRTPLRPHSRDS
jgi:catechol 2,3-dioxygenase-like lactoylglutathione lyase family enzyme